MFSCYADKVNSLAEKFCYCRLRRKKTLVGAESGVDLSRNSSQNKLLAMPLLALVQEISSITVLNFEVISV